MKLPTSSSIFLATLAISTSSSCLAAPTGDASTGQSMTPSSCSHLDGASPEAHMQPRSEGYANVEARDDGVVSQLPGVVGQLPGVVGQLSNTLEGLPLAGSIFKNLDTNSNPSPEQLTALQGATDEVSTVNMAGGVGSTPAGAIAAPIVSHSPSPARGAVGAGGASAAAPSQPASAAAAAAAPSAPAAPAAPSLPISPPVPPNTPTPP